MSDYRGAPVLVRTVRDSPLLALGSAGALAAFGAAEGFMFQRSRMVYPEVFFDQFWFGTYVLMKVFLSGVGCSLLCQGVYYRVNPQHMEATRFYKYNHRGVLRTVLGCVTLGSGMCLAATGPTMLPAAVASGVPHARGVLAGAVAGTAVYALLDAAGVQLTPRFALPGRTPPERGGARRTLDEVFTSYSYDQMALGLGTALLCVAGLFEVAFPHTHDMEKYSEGGRHLGVGWQPLLAGIPIGVGQIALRYVTGDGQGGSTSIHNWVATLTGGRLKMCEPYVLNRIGNWWQTIYVWVGTAAGAYLAATAFDEYSPSPEDIAVPSTLRAFVGGALMLFGSRLAGGCTCGHGISGFAELSIPSILGTCAIFGGAIGTGVMVKLGLIDF